MKRLLLFALITSLGVWAQNRPVSNPKTNLTERALAPTYSDIYCSGFVSKENIPTTHHILAGYESPHATQYNVHDLVYLTGTGYAVGNRYSVLRKVEDPNREQMFPGQHKLLNSSGFEYADLGRVLVTRMEKESAVAEVEFSCQPLAPGDFLVPFQERPQVQFRAQKVKFEEFAPYSGTAGRIIGAKDFDQVLGNGAKIYVNIGANKGLRPGDYLRVTRNYDPSDMNPVDTLSLIPPNREDTVKDGPKIGNKAGARLPYRGVGEVIVLSVMPETATAMITLSLEDMQVGDVVEIPMRAKQ